jgi:protein TIF31
MGYYINRSSMTRFDPTPIIAKNGDMNVCCYSHALLDCLLQKSTSLRSAWQSALGAAKERSDLLMQLSSPSSSLSSPPGSDGHGVSGVSDDTNIFDEDFVLYNNIFRSVASAYPNNASGPSASAAGAGSMTLNFLSSTSPTSFVSRLDMLTIRPPWLVPMPLTKMGDMAGTHQSTWDHDKLHTYDGSRAEEELTSYFGMDIRGGGLRDWNEELQTAREMPVSIFSERMERARLIHKILSDFGDAAILGVKAMIDGYIQPMNPNEQARSHVYLHNNIFFSRAIDAGLDTFKIIQGDAAAKKSASRDAHNIGVLHRLDVPGLHTLATVLVEYLGMRIVCQSVLPGILHGEKSHSILCGAVETLSKFQSKDDMLKLLESSIGQACMIATRAIPVQPLTDERMDIIKKYRITPVSEAVKTASMNEKEEETNDPNNNSENKSVQFCGPMEMKGILGSDKRKYVLDCTRLTPRDANWVSVSNGGTGRWEELYANQSTNATLVPPTLDDDEWTVCVLRSELFASYAALKIAELASTNVKDTQDEGTLTESESNVATINTIGEEKEVIAPEEEKNESTEQLKTDNFVQKLRFNGE